MISERWPSLPVSEWKDSYATIHRWTQIVGKTWLSLTPLVNHWWNSTLYVSPRGLTTATMHSGDTALEVEFDFVDHVLEIRSSRNKAVRLPLQAQSVAAPDDTLLEFLQSAYEVGAALANWDRKALERASPGPIE